MAKTSLELAPFARATRARPKGQRSRCAALLIGTGLLLHAAPALAVNECGPPPPGGGTVTCPAGTYPGISYFAPGALEIVLQPGVRTAGESIFSASSLRLLGPVDTILSPASSGTVALQMQGGSIFADLDQLISKLGSSPGVQAPGIYAIGGTITLRVREIRMSGLWSPGINAFGSGDLTIVTQLVETGGADSHGIRASAYGKVDITSNMVRTTGFGSTGISAYSYYDDVTINSSSIITQGDRSTAIQAEATGHLRIVSGSIETFGSGLRGISSETQAGGPVTVTSGTITTHGDFSPGMTIRGTEDVEVTSGTITTSGGSFSPGIMATSYGGTLKINSGTVTTVTSHYPAIWATSAFHSADVTAGNVSASGLNSDAIRIYGETLSRVTISGLVRSQQAFALRAEGGPTMATILAGGTLRGRVSLTDGGDRISNSGAFDAIGTSEFGAGADLFENNAGGTARSVNGAATFAGLETFSNRGTIEMRDDATNDSLALPGTYVGADGARLGLDVDFGAGTADRLVTGAATGSTLIELRPIGLGTLSTSGILLVDGGAGTTPTAFALAPGTDSAYLRSILRFDAANNDFLLDRTVGSAVFETARFGAMASQLWYESGDAVAVQLDTVRDGRRGRGAALWLQGWTGERERDGTQTLAGAGTFDVSFDQDFQGLQGGLDFQAGRFVVGVTAGTGRSDAAFASGNPVEMKVSNVGLYAQASAGPFFFNALAKRDWAELEIAPGEGLGAEFDADLLGVQANAGLRFDLGAFYAEPSVGLSWVQADLDSFASGPATVDPGDVDSLRARAGLRVGARLPLGGGALLPYLAANVYEELGGDNETDFTLGETLRLFDEPAGTRGQAAAGVSFAAAGFEAFVRGEMDFSGGTDAKAVRAGARLRF